MRSHAIAADGADALLRVDRRATRRNSLRLQNARPRRPPAIRKASRSRSHPPHPLPLFMASRADIEERLRPLVDGVEDFIAKPFFIKDLGPRSAKKVIDRLHLEKLQKHASRPGVIPGSPRRNEHDRSAAVARNGAEILPPSWCREAGRPHGELYFASGQCRDARKSAPSKATTPCTR
jgi:CheY-like chemotaxis protein